MTCKITHLLVTHHALGQLVLSHHWKTQKQYVHINYKSTTLIHTYYSGAHVAFQY
jgi:hypothetical protein